MVEHRYNDQEVVSLIPSVCLALFLGLSVISYFHLIVKCPQSGPSKRCTLLREGYKLWLAAVLPGAKHAQ